VIYQSGGRININYGTSFTPGYTLTVNGGVSSLGTGFKGIGTDLVQLNASAISTGYMSTSRINNVSTGNQYWILTGGSNGGVGQAQFTNPSLLTVGKATSLSVSRTIWGQSFDGSANVSGTMSNVGIIIFGNNSNKLTLEWPGSAPGKTVKFPSLIVNQNNASIESTVVIAEQSNYFYSTQYFSGLNSLGVLINTPGESLRLQGNGSTAYIDTTFIPTIGTNNYQATNASRYVYLYSATVGQTGPLDGNDTVNNNNIRNFLCHVKAFQFLRRVFKVCFVSMLVRGLLRLYNRYDSYDCQWCIARFFKKLHNKSPRTARN
jgi:hypothetical protein